MKNRRVGPLAAGALVFPVVLACPGADGPSDLVEVRDSAGVKIVYSAGAQWTDGNGWTVSPEPAVIIGAAYGDETETLYRISEVSRLDDGNILVVQWSNDPFFRIYSWEGAHVRSFGATGDGPREYRAVSEVCDRGDTLYALDDRIGRLSVLTVQGEVIEVTSMPAVFTEAGLRTDVTVWLDWFAGCDALGRSNGVGPPAGAGITFPWWRLDIETLEQDTIVEVFADPWNDQGEWIRYASFPWAAAGDSTVLISYTGDFKVAEYTKEGRLLKRFERAYNPVRISDGEVDRLRETQSSRHFAEHWPAHTPRMVVDEEGALWLHDFRRPWEELESEDWSVFDSAGVFLGVVETPSGLDIHEIGSDYILGVWTDSLDVETVRAFRLNRRS